MKQLHVISYKPNCKLVVLKTYRQHRQITSYHVPKPLLFILITIGYFNILWKFSWNTKEELPRVEIFLLIELWFLWSEVLLIKAVKYVHNSPENQTVMKILPLPKRTVFPLTTFCKPYIDICTHTYTHTQTSISSAAERSHWARGATQPPLSIPSFSQHAAARAAAVSQVEAGVQTLPWGTRGCLCTSAHLAERGGGRKAPRKPTLCKSMEYKKPHPAKVSTNILPNKSIWINDIYLDLFNLTCSTPITQ